MTEEALRSSQRGSAVLDAARARHAAMSPQRRALADVDADVFRLLVVATTYDLATRAMEVAGVPRAVWRHAHGPEALHGHPPGTPLLWLGAPLSVDGPGRTPEMLATIAAKHFVQVDIADVADILGDSPDDGQASSRRADGQLPA